MSCFHASITENVEDVKLVADLAGDVSLVCNIASEDSSLLLNKDEFNSASSSLI